MEDRESGNLSRKPALELLVELHRGSVTGSLKLERAPLQKAVYFRDGQILFAASNDPKDQLASILVEEGKLGPDQMQVAQARVSPGNPLAKVLTELGYISQRELAEAARVKVEKILTDLYTWKEGTYQFATKSLPKGAIDLELSTSRLLFASIRRVQDRDWVLRQLGSLETVLVPTPSLPQFLAQTEPEPLAGEVLKLADGMKTVKQIGSVSSLGEFEVCKVLAAALVAGALGRADAPTIPLASDDAFSFPQAQENFSFPPPPKPSFGNETMSIPEIEASSSSDPSQSMSYDTVYQAAVVSSPSPNPVPAPEEDDRTVFEPAPPPVKRAESSRPHPLASELVIDEPEPASDAIERNPPRPKGRRGGGGSGGGGLPGILKWVAVAALVGAAGFSIYYFVWPLVGGKSGGDGREARAGSVPAPTTTVPPTTAPSETAPAPSTAAAETTTAPLDPRAATAGTPSPSTSSVAPRAGAATPPAAATTSRPPDAAPTPSTSGAPKPPPTSSAPRTAARGDARSLLQSGNLTAAARAFQQEISSSGADKFTLALGLYCNEENAGRLVAGAGGASDIYVLPTSVEGRSCIRVMWGLYDSREAAERGIASLPNGVRAGDVAPVAVARFLR
jgi:septal ring-binding cell division protein DamX